MSNVAKLTHSFGFQLLQGDQTYDPKNLGLGQLELVYSIRNLTSVMPTIVQLDDHDYGKPLFSRRRRNLA